MTDRLSIIFLSRYIMMSNRPINSCPKDKPHKCDAETVAYGLCRKNIMDCHKREVDYPDIGWDVLTNTDKYLKRCDTETRIHLMHNPPDNNVRQPAMLRIISWNVWGEIKTNKKYKKEYKKEYLFLSDLMILRARRFAHYIEEYDPHIILLQEASEQMIGCIKLHLPDSYHYYGAGALHLITKYKPHDIYYHSFDRTKSECQFIIFENLLITNLYIRPPDDHSNAPSNEHQIRCIGETLKRILQMSDEYMPRFNILCGDFGADLNDRSIALQPIKQIGAMDCWVAYYPREKGYTEDIDLNQMSRCIKLATHNSRMCGLFLKGIQKILNAMALVSCELIGCEGFIMSHKSFQQMHDIYGETMDRTMDRTTEHLYFVSNHFGVFAEFGIDQNYTLI